MATKVGQWECWIQWCCYKTGVTNCLKKEIHRKESKVKWRREYKWCWYKTWVPNYLLQKEIHRKESKVKWRRESEDGNVEYNDVVTKQE